MNTKPACRHLVRLMLAQLCALAAVTPTLAQQVKPEATPPAAPAATPAQPAGSELPSDDETIVLSPFTVQSSKSDIGYYASNTLAGSRLNSKVGDLAAPITVITKQQLEDTGARDLNDVFLYEANTEGANNYTPVEINRGGLKDRVGGSATNGIGANTAVTANRIRGLVNADMTWNYYASITRMRADVYNADSLEISRGPNSILAGLGSPAGILNQSISTGRINSNSNEVNLAYGSYGAYRASFSVNRTLIPDKLAINVAALYDDRAFSRKPSYDISRRQSGGFTYRPFKKTTIKGFVEGYTNDSRTPNQMTPRDAVTPWLNAGRPVWDPITRQVTWLDTGVVSAPYVFSDFGSVPTSSTNPALVRITGDAVLTDARQQLPGSAINRYVPGLGFPNLTRPARMISPDGSVMWVQSQAQVFDIYNLTPAQVTGSFNSGGYVAATGGVGSGSYFDFYNRRLTQSSLPAAPYAYETVGGAVYIAPGVSNKSVYNWEGVNLSAANYGSMRNATYNLELEQQILPDLFFSAGWFKQDLDTFEHYPIAQLAPATLAIDTNKFLPNGSNNPNYLRPFVDTQDPDIAETPETNETFRAMLAYDLDLTKRDGWLKWLGRHRLLGFAQRQENNYTQIRSRFAFSDPSDPRYVRPLNALGLRTARPAGFRYAADSSATRQIYYVGDAGGMAYVSPSTTVGNPARYATETASILSYNYGINAYDQASVTYGSEWFDAGGGAQRTQKIVNSLSFAAQSYWLNDRIVTTYGVRRDKWAGRNTTTGTDENGNVLGATAAAINSALYPVGSWRLADQQLNLLERWGPHEYIEKTTGSLGAVVKPFPWISLFANTSDNFNPPPSAATDIFGKKLSTPTGESKDFGVSFNLFDNKLIARVTVFETKLEKDRSNPNISTMLGRLQRQDSSNLKGWAEAVVRVRSGQAITDNWTDLTVNPLTAAQQDQVAALMGGLPYNWPAGLSITSTQDAKAEGVEFEVIYNPTTNWNIKLTAAKQETSYTNILPEYDAWVSARRAVWDAAVAPDMAALYTQPNNKQYSLQKFTTGYGFGETNGQTGVNGFNPDDWFQKVVASELANARQLEGAAPYGQRKWRANIISNYLVTNGFLKNFGFGGAVRWEDRAVIGYRGVMGANGQWLRSDASSPIYDTKAGTDRLKDLTHVDLWLSYRFKIWSDKVRTKVQFNVVDVFEPGGIVPVYANFDGTPAAYRIVDSRRMTLSAKFEF